MNFISRRRFNYIDAALICWIALVANEGHVFVAVLVAIAGAIVSVAAERAFGK